jgi:mRNA-degrading endonuclease toxin of MazEF toxin-antitoxin module
VGARERARSDPRRALVARGEVAWLELEQEGRRPVVVLTRDEALPRLRNVVVALVTRTIRGIDTEVELGPAEGMPIACAVSGIAPIAKSLITSGRKIRQWVEPPYWKYPSSCPLVT